MTELTLKKTVTVQQAQAVEQPRGTELMAKKLSSGSVPKICGCYKGRIEFLYDWKKYNNKTKQNELIQKDVLGKRTFEMKIKQEGNNVKFTMKTEYQIHEKRKKEGKQPILFTRCESILGKLVKKITKASDGSVANEKYVLNGIYITKPPVWQKSHLVGCRIDVGEKVVQYKDKKTGEQKRKIVYELTKGEYWTNVEEKNNVGQIIFEGKKSFTRRASFH